MLLEPEAAPAVPVADAGAAPAPLGPAVANPGPVSSSGFFCVLSNPGLSGLPGKVGLRRANREEKLRLLGREGSLSLDLEFMLNWSRRGRSLVPPSRLNAIVRGVIGLRAPAVDADVVLSEAVRALAISLSDMAGILPSEVVGESRCA